MAATKIRKPANKPTNRELFENHTRDSARRADVETEYNALGHAITAYLLSHTSRKNRTDADNEYFSVQYEALQTIEARLRAALDAARNIDEASCAAWFASLDGK